MTEARLRKTGGCSPKNIDMDTVSKSAREFEDALKKVQRASK
jgi:hypothetical protein